MLTPYLPYPPSSGGQVRSYNLIKQLSKNHKITLVSLIKSPKEKEFIKKLEPFCEKVYACRRSETPWTFSNIIKSVLGKYPFLIVRNFSKEAQTVIKKLLESEKFDLIHAETFYVMPHIPKTDIPTVLVEQTIEFKVYEHFVKNIKYSFFRAPFYYDIFKLTHWEKHFWKKATSVVAVSESDRSKMVSIMPKLNVNVIPNGAGEELISIYTNRKTIKDITLLYVGNFTWLQNIEAVHKLALKILPIIRKKIPKIKCIIAGQSVDSKLTKIKNSKYIKKIDLKNNDTNQVIDLYKNSSIFIAPISGPGGTRLKILAAMASGMPVISSKVGVEGLKVKNNKHVLIAKNDNNYPELVNKLVRNRTLYNYIRKNARDLVIQIYSYEKIAKKLSKLYVDISKTK